MAASGRNRISINGGSFHQSAVGIGSIQQSNLSGPEEASASDLLSLLAELRDEIVALGGSERKREVVADRIDEVQNEVAEPDPDADIVRGGWKSVLRLLDAGARASESISKITDLISTLFGT